MRYYQGDMQYIHLSIEEREKIQLCLWEKRSARQIAKELNRSVSTVSREIKKNISYGHGYMSRPSHQRALVSRKSRGRHDRLKNKTIRDYVISELKKRTSPEQIAGRIGIAHPGQSISHEAIYQFIYSQIHRDGWGLLRPGHEDLRLCLRRRKKRRTHKYSRRCQRVLKAPVISIDLRPKIVDQKTRIGDWESDSVASCDNKPGINTFEERKSGLVFITKLADKTSQSTLSAIESRTRFLPKELKQTATFDNGSENQRWEELQTQTGFKCFFAHAYHFWERGANENTNGLIRDFFPKKTDFTKISPEELQAVENNLNNRPRKRLNWLTPNEVFQKELNKFNIQISNTNITSVALAD
jgi:IS30 family transposase